MTSTFRFDELTLECVSRAGDETWVKVQPPGLAIDAGRGTPRLQGVREVFLTHGHLDHSLGTAYLLSLRRDSASEGVHFYAPRQLVDPLDRFLAAAGALDGTRFRYEITALDPGTRVDVGSELSMEAFPTVHGVVSLGYHLLRRRRRLRRDLEGLGEEAIVERRRRGEDVDEIFEERWFSCAGDTSRGVFDLAPEIFSSRVLMLECTFIQADQRDRSVRYQHLHLEDLVEVGERFENEALILNHLSRRHRVSDLRRAVDRQLGAIQPEVLLVGERR